MKQKRPRVGEAEKKKKKKYAMCHLHPNKEGIHGFHLQAT
jgi:hypothetical protein